MMTLFYFPGLCSLASHIALEEVGARYECHLVDIMKGENAGPEYQRINPRAQVPALKVDNSVLTETVAILYYVAKQFPGAGLAPASLFEEARWLSWSARMATAMHPAFTRVARPDFIVDDKNLFDAVRGKAREKYSEFMNELDQALSAGPWILGAQYTTCDAQALVLYGWGARAGFPMVDFKNFTAWKDKMLERKAVQTVLKQEKSPLLQVA